MNKCDACGIEKGLRKIENVYLRTKGNPVLVKKGYICKRCEWKIIKKDLKLDKTDICGMQ